MKTVWIVEEEVDYEPGNILGVFATEEAAEEHRQWAEKTCSNCEGTGKGPERTDIKGETSDDCIFCRHSVDGPGGGDHANTYSKYEWDVQ